MLNAISVDVEEYFHATNMDPFIGPARWHSMPSRVDATTRALLDLFARHNARGTFFILGYVARRFPHLVRDIAASGHEIASHGYSHRLAYNQTERAFYRDIYRTKRMLEDISGRRVHGYRAPNFSIKDQNAWAYDQLIRAGYTYDSSVYPVWHPRYANQHRPRFPNIIKRENGELLEFPLAVNSINLIVTDLRLPVAGGAYWRLLPLRFLSWGLNRINRRDRLPFVCYLHPWEIDAGQPRVEEFSYLTKLRHYGGIPQFPDRIGYFLNMFRFVPLCEIAESVFGEKGKLALRS